MNTKEKYPLIQLFQTPLGYYVYDTYINEIAEISEESFTELSAYVERKSTSPKIVSNSKEIQGLINKGWFSNNRPIGVVHFMDSNYKYYLDNYMSSITLQLTQSCNLRCAYCIYSETANESQRNHTNRAMHIDTAYKAVDFLMEHSNYCETVNVGFYGGEPLLCFPQIRKTVEYIHNNYPEKNVSYHITSNGTLLSPPIMDFFAENNFNMLISLDGPQNIHDKSRIYANNGQGSFSTIMNNLTQLAERHPNYMCKIGLSVVVLPDNSYRDTIDFVNDMRDRYGVRVHLSFVDDSYSAVKHQLTPKYLNTRKAELIKGFWQVWLKGMDAVDPSVSSHFYEVYNINKVIGKKDSSEIISPAGPCVPGGQRLMVDVNGEFFPCERVSEKSPMMNIGNVNEGYDYEKIRKLLNVATTTLDHCTQCWAYRFCNQCVRNSDNGEELSGAKRLSNCYKVVHHAKEIIYDYILMKEASSIYDKAMF